MFLEKQRICILDYKEHNKKRSLASGIISDDIKENSITINFSPNPHDLDILSKEINEAMDNDRIIKLIFVSDKLIAFEAVDYNKGEVIMKDVLRLTLRAGKRIKFSTACCKPIGWKNFFISKIGYRIDKATNKVIVNFILGLMGKE